MKWTEADVLAILRRGYCEQAGWMMLVQVEVLSRRLDALLIDDYGTRMAIEVKTSRADFRNESDAKRSAAEAVAHVCFYAAPAGMLAAEDMPPGWGLIPVNHSTGTIGLISGPRPSNPRIPTPEHTERLLAAIAGRAWAAEEAIRRAQTPAYENAALHAEVERLTGVLERARQARDLERDRARAALSEMLAAGAGTQECADCGEPLYWHLSLAGPAWKHAWPAAEAACQRERAETARLAQEARTGARYLTGRAGPVQPRALREKMEQ